MPKPLELLRRIHMLLHRGRFQSDLEEEMRLHLDLREQEQCEAGLSRQAAHQAAYRRFGNPTAIKEKSHTTWGWDWLEDFFEDIGYGFRSMLRSPGLTAVALLSLALGIGANTAIFSFLNAVLLRSLPVRNSSQLVVLGEGGQLGQTSRYGSTDLYSYPFYRQFQQKQQVFSEVATLFSYNPDVHGTIDRRDQMQPIAADLVSGNFFSTLGVEPAIGRLFTDADDNSEGDHPVVVISYNWWQTVFSGDPHILKHTVKIGDTTFDIVGVAPPGFFGIFVGHTPDLWAPMSMMNAMPLHFTGYKDNFSQSNLILARLKPGVSREQAEAHTNV